MSIPAKVLPGFSASLWMQSAATPTPLSTANLSVWAAQVTTIVGTSANGTGAAGVAVPVEAIPAFGQDDAVASFGVAGSRQSDKIPVAANCCIKSLASPMATFVFSVSTLPMLNNPV